MGSGSSPDPNIYYRTFFFRYSIQKAYVSVQGISVKGKIIYMPIYSNAVLIQNLGENQCLCKSMDNLLFPPYPVL